MDAGPLIGATYFSSWDHLLGPLISGTLFELVRTSNPGSEYHGSMARNVDSGPLIGTTYFSSWDHLLGPLISGTLFELVRTSNPGSEYHGSTIN